MPIKVKGVSNTEKKIMVFDTEPQRNGKYRAYNYNGPLEITEEDKNIIQKNVKVPKYEFILIPRDKEYRGTLEDFYNEVLKDAYTLREITKGKINMFKTGSHTKTSLKYLVDILEENGINKEIEKIEKYESDFFLHNGGAFRYAEKYEGRLYKYDARSYFSYIYSMCHLLIPIKKGTLTTITQKEVDEREFLQFGIYRAKVERPTDKRQKLIWINENNFYTHYELNYCKEKGINFKIIEEENNLLTWTRDQCKTGSQIFGEFTKTLYRIKETGHRNAKKLLTRIWGILCRKNMEVIIYDPNKDDDEDDEIIEIDGTPIPLLNGKFKIKKMREDKFEYDLARMKPFFMAKCRLYIAKTIEPILDFVKYSHTDSIISSVKLNLPDKGKLGQFKFEGICEKGFIRNGTDRSPNEDFLME